MGGEPDYAPALRALVHPLRQRMIELGWSQAQVAIRLGCDRSRVSRALSGREVPPLDRVEQLAGVLGADVAEARGRWREVVALRRRATAGGAPGAPPYDLRSYAEFIAALRELLRRRAMSQREAVRRDRSRILAPSTVSAVLRGERSARRDVTQALVRACGVSEEAAAAWDLAWCRLALPHRDQLHQRRINCYRHVRERVMAYSFLTDYRELRHNGTRPVFR